MRKSRGEDEREYAKDQASESERKCVKKSKNEANMENVVTQACGHAEEYEQKSKQGSAKEGDE